MTQIIEYRTRNKGRASPGAECASASGNLGTIALVNSQFLFWLVSKEGGGGRGQVNHCFAAFSQKGEKVYRGRWDSPFRYRSPRSSSRYPPWKTRCTSSTLCSWVINLSRIFERSTSGVYPLGISAFFPPVMQSTIRRVHPFTILRSGNGAETSQGNRVSPFESSS